ncbi:MAG: efflux RND transporter periplasmic adaptor subunit [Alphaproteobacteria bacterium]|nr:efflux RND transporter periplasmic adaptor subunit [Alphaproteobacteria bacterium]
MKIPSRFILMACTVFYVAATLLISVAALGYKAARSFDAPFDLPEVVVAFPDFPSLPELPDLPSVSEIWASIKFPELPDMPELPTLPALPSASDIMSYLPDAPEFPELPSLPDVSGFMQMPDFPEFPAMQPLSLSLPAVSFSTVSWSLPPFSVTSMPLDWPRLARFTPPGMFGEGAFGGDDEVWDVAVTAEDLAAITPAAGTDGESSKDYDYPAEDPEISVDAVLVPQQTTVISSSRDGKIKNINVKNGDVFRKGDVLLEYDCRDIEAEVAARESEESLSRQKSLRSAKLLKLEIISEIENLTLNTEQKKAESEKQAMQQRLDSCIIRADYNGRVTNRLANPGEYTRTDRVLMEVSSLDDMEAQFLLPSRWLRWINTGAEIEINLSETGHSYKAHVNRIHGEVDPASQSIQVSAMLAPYEDPLLPGMSGQAMISVEQIRRQGVTGYLETKRQR